MSTHEWIKFFGIDDEYFKQVRTKEIFSLIEHGFDYPSLMSMRVTERRFYFMMLVEKHAAQAEKNKPISKPR